MAKPNTNIYALYGYADQSSIIMITVPPGDRHTLNIVILARNLLVKHRLFWYYRTSVCSYRRTTCRRNDESSTISYLSVSTIICTTMNFLPTGLKEESAKWSLSFRVLWLEPLLLFYSVNIYIICSGYFIFCF